MTRGTAAGSDAYVERFGRLGELERREEMERHQREIRSLSGAERQRKGRAFLQMRGRDEGEALEGRLPTFLRRPGENLRRAGIADRDIGIISPYADQADRVARELEDARDLEVHSVDGFQGREKEVILASLVRSNDRGEVGFLRDVRRLNVTLTRARRKLVVVGDAAKLETEEASGAFAEYAERAGARMVL